MLTRTIPVWSILGLLALAGCAGQTERVDRPQGLDEAAALLQASAEEPGAWTYLDPSADLASYRRFILDPPRVYRGSDAAGFAGKAIGLTPP